MRTENGAHVAYHPLLGYYSSSRMAVVDRNERKSNRADKEDKASDHAPVLIRFN